jgi:hypothetical protein
MTMNFGRYADVSNAVLAAGFFSASVARCYGWDRISFASRCDTTSGRLHGLSFWMTEIGTSWYAGTWGGHVYRVPRAANVTELAIEFLRTATEMMDFSSDLKQRFGLIELT